ncbi:MAG TPA: hypothetical protein VJT31_29965, partial [Rugosimonospora sp.]|nr:hypothetical protein [Rugosimonospora sp.]
MDRHDADPLADDALTALTAGHTAFLAGVDEVLDVEAGLADALLPARQTRLVSELDEVLDVEAGLAAILPSGTSADPAPAGSGQPMTGPETEPVAPAAGTAARDRYTFRVFALLAATVRQPDPRTRLTLRSDPRFSATINAVSLLLVLALALDRARALDRALDFAVALDRALDRDLARDLARDL